MKRVYKKLSVSKVTPEYHQRTCGYWYVVRSEGCPHTAFGCKRGLEKWASERGLKLPELPDAKSEHGHGKIEGEYTEESHMSYDAFYALPAIMESKAMSNADWTLSRITEDENGFRTIHTLNPNMKHRPVYDYQSTGVEMGSGYVYE